MIFDYSIKYAMSSLSEQSNQSNNIIFDASEIKYCIGPCSSKIQESPPIFIGDKKHHQFKPYSGGKYAKCCYPLSENCSLIIKNFRICNSCNKRYLENYDEKDFKQLAIDGNTILKKLEI